MQWTKLLQPDYDRLSEDDAWASKIENLALSTLCNIWCYQMDKTSSHTFYSLWIIHNYTRVTQILTETLIVYTQDSRAYK